MRWFYLKEKHKQIKTNVWRSFFCCFSAAAANDNWWWLKFNTVWLRSHTVVKWTRGFYIKPTLSMMMMMVMGRWCWQTSAKADEPARRKTKHERQRQQRKTQWVITITRVQMIQRPRRRRPKDHQNWDETSERWERAREREIEVTCQRVATWFPVSNASNADFLTWERSESLCFAGLSSALCDWLAEPFRGGPTTLQTAQQWGGNEHSRWLPLPKLTTFFIGRRWSTYCLWSLLVQVCFCSLVSPSFLPTT